MRASNSNASIRLFKLGGLLERESLSESKRGEVLQRILVDLSKRFPIKDAAYYSELLRLYYFEEIPPGEVQERLNIRRTKLSQDRRMALSLLANELIRFMYPALRLEEPPIQTTLLERESSQKAVYDLLRARNMVAVIGASGIGKTLFAATVSRSFIKAGGNAFWYTIRPDLNDQVESFIFALGFFAHQQGFSILWQELIATQGKAASEPKREKLLQMLRHLFSQMRPAPLLCIDEVEQLQSNPDQASLIRLIESLRGHVPMLLVGQHCNIVCDHSERLAGLNEESMAELLRLHRVKLSRQQQSQLHQITQGNPRFIQLYCHSIQGIEKGDKKEADLLTTLPNLPILETLLSRVLQRLSAAELETLLQVSVYPTPAPAYIGKAAIIENLFQKQLLQSDGKGSVEMPSLYRPLIEKNLTTQQHTDLHQQAALIRSASGMMTAAAYHWIEAGNPQQAVLDWEKHQSSEINQGQAATALRLFRRLTHKEIPTKLREQIHLLCGNLENLVGQPVVALEDIRSLLQKQSLAAIEANDLAGRIHNDRFEKAKSAAAFGRAQGLAESMLEVRLAHIHKGLAWAFWNESELQQVEQEIELVAYELENMRGNLARDRGDFSKALAHYRAAIALADAIAHEAGIAKSCNQMAAILMWRGEFAECFQILARAYAVYERIGKVRSMAGALISMSVAHNLAGSHEQALQKLEQAEKLLAFLFDLESNLKIPILQARAEAYLGLGELDKAEALAYETLQLEDVKMSRDAGWVLGEVAIQRKMWEKAEQLLQESIQMSESDSDNPDRYLAALALRSLSIVYTHQRRQQEAIHCRQRAIAHFSALQLENEVAKTNAALLPSDNSYA